MHRGFVYDLVQEDWGDISIEDFLNAYQYWHHILGYQRNAQILEDFVQDTSTCCKNRDEFFAVEQYWGIAMDCAIPWRDLQILLKGRIFDQRLVLKTNEELLD